MKNVCRRQIRTLLTSLILALCLGCATKNMVQAPTGRIEVQPAAFNQYSPEQDIEIGRQATAEVNRQMPVLPDSNPVSKYVQQLGQQLAVHGPGQVKWPFSFHVVNIKEINAFALPGGPIYIHIGTIRRRMTKGSWPVSWHTRSRTWFCVIPRSKPAKPHSRNFLWRFWVQPS